MIKKPVAAQDKFMLRLPDGMRDTISGMAEKHGRSMNSEIVQIIEDAIEAEKSGFPAGDARELRKVISMQNDLIHENSALVQKMSETFALAFKKLKKAP
ncbi:Arc family DNA-binding protein [Xenorhabdus bovienii]|uniref:Arc family DNA-binding protein n=1 Tax=Xenorhabdus bovienii TaxID=40576 RepID=UPI003DA4079D